MILSFEQLEPDRIGTRLKAKRVGSDWVVLLRKRLG
jgi:hypothetical protein